MCTCDDPCYYDQSEETQVVARKNLEAFLGKPAKGWVHPDWALAPDVKQKMREIIKEFENDRHI